jgi:protein subunit release factor B
MLSSAKEEELRRRMEQLGILDEHLVEKFIRGSGHGGQKINKTSSCVYLKHEPSGIEIKCQQDRSQTMNRYHARVELCERLEEIEQGKKSIRQQAREKIRRQKRRQSRRQRQKNVGLKRKHGLKKKLRKGPGRND